MHRRRRCADARRAPCAGPGRNAGPAAGPCCARFSSGAGQPVLQGQEIGAHILRGAGDEAQQLRQLPQHLHLAVAARLRCLCRCRAAASAWRRRHWPVADMSKRPMRVSRTTSPADRQQTMASQAIAARFQRRQHGADVVFQKQHGRDHDVAARDIGVASSPARRDRRPIRRRNGPRGRGPAVPCAASRARARQRRPDGRPSSRSRREPASSQRPKCAFAS